MLERGAVIRSPGALVAVAMAVGTVAVMLWRMLYGVDFTDEAFYVALPMRFVLGDQPFVHELNIGQTAGLFLYPFVKVYTALCGASGIMLFIRVLYLAFFALVGWSVYAFAMTLRLPRSTGLLLGVTCICFLPHGLPGLSYNTISMGLFAIGLFVTARWLSIGKRSPRVWRSAVFWAGVAHGGACFAYPTLVLATVVTALAILALASGERIRGTLSYAAGGCTFALLVSPLFLAAGLAHVREVLAYSGGGGAAAAFTTQAVQGAVTGFLQQNPQLPLAAFVVALAMTLGRRWPLLTAAAAVFFPVLAQGSTLTGPRASLGYVSCFALLGPILSLALRDRRTARILVLAVALPSAVVATAMTLTSGNGVLAAGIGLYPSALVTAVVLAMFIDECSKRARWSGARELLALSPATAIWMLLQYAVAQDGFYRGDGTLSQFTARIAHGPYKYLYTTPAKAEYLRTLSADIAAHPDGERALFAYDNPVGYLIANRRPLISSPWTFPLPTREERDARLFMERAKPGDLVIRDHSRGGASLDRAIVDRSTLILTRPSYNVYIVR